MAGAAETGDESAELWDDVRRPVWRLLTSYYRSHVHYFGFNLLTTLSARLLGLYPPVMVGVAFDAVLFGQRAYELPFVPQRFIPETRMAQFWFTVGSFVALYAAGAVLYVLGGLARNVATYRVQHELRTDVYATMQDLEYSFFEGEQTGELMSILNNDVNQLEEFFQGTLQRAANVVFIVGSVGFYMLVLNWQLALVAFVGPVVIVAVNFWYSNYVEPKHAAIRSRVGGLNSRIENNVDGIGIVKAYNRESFEEDRVEEASEEYRDGSWVVARARILFGQTAGLFINSGYVIVFLVGGYWVLQGPPPPFSGELAAGTVLTFLMYNRQFSAPLMQATDLVDSYQRTRASGSRVLGLVDEAEDHTDRETGTDLGDVRGRVEYDHVTFTYESGDEPALRDLSFEAESGEMVGLVGPTGAGKSTVVKLLLRFYDVDDGAIRVDGHDVADVSAASLRRAIGYVEQEPFLFDGTVRENVAYGRPDADDDVVEAAARSAGAHEFVADLPEGYDTEVGERGVKLSGGQRQRISIARAILRDPAILVLDEATSHVDNETEILIQNNLADLRADRTTFVVAHRLSTVCDADRILVLDDGAVVEQGTHEELLEHGGVYANLWRVQVGEVDALPEEFVERTVGVE